MEAMLMGAGEPESWVMDWAPPLGAELWSLEEIEAAFTEPSLTASSLGSWADKCEWADAALAAAEAQMGRGCTDESTEGVTATAEAQLEKEDWEWLTALAVATAPPQPHPAGAVDQLPGKKEAPRPTQGPPPVKGAQRSLGAATGKGGGRPQNLGAGHQRGPRREKAPPPQQPTGARGGRDPGAEGGEGRVDPAR